MDDNSWIEIDGVAMQCLTLTMFVNPFQWRRWCAPKIPYLSHASSADLLMFKSLVLNHLMPAITCITFYSSSSTRDENMKINGSS